MRGSRLFLIVPAVPIAVTGLAMIFTGSNCACGSASPIRVGTIAPAAPMLAARSGHTATLLPDGRVLIAGGMRRNQDFYRSAELYDPNPGEFAPAGGFTSEWRGTHRRRK